jgi:hypothetical protein
MVLNLETPIGSNFMKDWPSQNGVNCDRIDDYAGPCLTSHPIQSYTPVLTASVTSPVLGTGSSIFGRYYVIFDQVYTWGEFRYGTAASIGSGIYRISLPFRAKTLINTNNPFETPLPVGNGIVFDESADAGRQAVIAQLGSPDFLVFSVRMGTAGASRGVTHNTPIIWSGLPPGDGMMWSARYQRDPS